MDHESGYQRRYEKHAEKVRKRRLIKSSKKVKKVLTKDERDAIIRFVVEGKPRQR